MKDYPQEELLKAKKLVASFIKSAEEVEEVYHYVLYNQLITGWTSLFSNL